MKRILLALFLIASLVIPVFTPSPASASTTLTLRPDAAGTIAELTPSAGANWSTVDETPASDTDYVITPTAQYYHRKDTYGLPDPTPSGAINWVEVFYRWECVYVVGDTWGFAKATVRTYSTYYYGTEYSRQYSQYWGQNSTRWTTNPNTGSAWTWTEINSLEAGISLSGGGWNNAACSQLYVEVSYEDYPAVTTQAVTSIAGVTATGNGTITSIGIDAPTKRGICWNTTGTPTVGDSKTEEVGSFGTGVFTEAMTSLSLGTLYYVRAYAYNTAGYGYGNQVTFTTLNVPILTANAASNIASTTARLNGTVDSDGGIACQIEWGYSKVSGTFASYVGTGTVTAPAGAYTTGQHPYYDASSLLPYVAPNNTPYYYRFRLTNAAGTTTSGEITFNTTSGISDPTNLSAFPSSTSVSLTWVKGTGSTNSMVRYGTSTFPTSTSEGQLVYLGTNSSSTHTGLTSGHTYYYSVWGISGLAESAGYAYALATTSATGAAGQTLETPVAPPRWLSAPDYTNLSNLLIVYDAVNGVADSLSMPRETVWMMLALMGAAILGIAVYMVSGNKMFPGIIAMILALIFGWAIKIVSFWIPLFAIILIIGLWTSHREAEY